uniref:Uncharacterized protein n=1 Tax=Anguilla anguilla TaxID=7936 RepID=A0A0E9VC00_ANGAN
MLTRTPFLFKRKSILRPASTPFGRQWPNKNNSKTITKEVFPSQFMSFKITHMIWLQQSLPCRLHHMSII